MNSIEKPSPGIDRFSTTSIILSIAFIFLGIPIIAVYYVRSDSQKKLMPHQESEAAAEVQKQQRLKDKIEGDQLASKMKYFYDERTGLTFAYLLEDGNGGPAITLVPYEKVKHLLRNPPTENPNSPSDKKEAYVPFRSNYYGTGPGIDAPSQPMYFDNQGRNRDDRNAVLEDMIQGQWSSRIHLQSQ